ncbi:phytanoyl-CoA dioxygenase family protein [Ravibacter arvi]|uniref:Phytanoyl-CoA dioxygenase family protein n=1 Tax=Ravibacter arvi TaxID=2051041 RepID=A0ABP8M291_9BACT
MNKTLNPPDLSGYKNITEEQQTYFRENGHVLIPGVLNADEVAFYREAINAATFANNKETRDIKDRDTYGKAFLQVMNLWTVDPVVKHFTLAQRFAKIAADLLGVDRVRLYHDQALYKEPGGGHTPWHQDQYYWPLDTRNTVTMWMPLVDIDVDMGMLTFASGSHKKGFAVDVGISDQSENEFLDLIQSQGMAVTRAETMKAGDATWHYGWTFHAAPGNNTPDRMREVMTVIYFADGARVTEPQNQNQQADLDTWLRSRPVGSLADSDLNPLVYAKQ